LIELNAPLAIAPDILSLIPVLQAPVESTNESATVAQNFSALLTELMGSLEEPAAQAPAAPQQTTPVQEVGPQTPGLVPPMISVEEPETKAAPETPETPETAEAETTETAEIEPKKKEPKETVTQTKPEPTSLVLVPVEIPTVELPQGQQTVEQHQPAAPPGPSSAEEGSSSIPALRLAPESLEKPQVQAATKPEVEKAWAEVRKFEFTVEHEAPQRVTQQPQAPAAPADAAQKQAMITTDPIINLRQEKLPPRIVMVQNAGIETRLPDRGKPEPGMPATGTTAAPTSHFSDVIRTFDHIEQARPAQPIEIPVAPQLKVVRTVSMEVGDADSRVVIRIQERSGDVSMQLKAGSESLRHELQSSVESLVSALRHEEVKVTNVEVSRKSSPVDKIRRMKEAH
jgi:flagellar motor protein MotB